MSEIDLEAIKAAHAYWRKAHESDDTDEWHLAANDVASYVPALLAEVRTLRDVVEPFGECAPDCDCGDHQRVCLCHVTGTEAREWIRREEARADQAEKERDQLREDDALACAVLSQRDTEIRLLREQRDKVLALAAQAKIGMTQHCWCPEGDDGALIHSPYCKGPQSYWDLDPAAVVAIFSPALPAQGQTEETRS